MNSIQYNEPKNQIKLTDLVLQISVKELKNFVNFAIKSAKTIPVIDQQIKIQDDRLYYKSKGYKCSCENSFWLINSNLKFDWIDAGELLRGLKSLKIPTFTKSIVIQPSKSLVLKEFDFEDMNPIEFVYTNHNLETKKKPSYYQNITSTIVTTISNINNLQLQQDFLF